MTAGRAVVLGDPGPWFCAGQTGGRVYLRVNDDWGLDREALERRRGKGAKVALATSTPRACSTCRSCSAPTPASCAGTGPGRRGRADAGAGGRAGAALPDVGARARADGPVGFDRIACAHADRVRHRRLRLHRRRPDRAPARRGLGRPRAGALATAPRPTVRERGRRAGAAATSTTEATLRDGRRGLPRSPSTPRPRSRTGATRRSSSASTCAARENVIAACRAAGVRRLVHVGTEAALMARQPLVDRRRDGAAAPRLAGALPVAARPRPSSACAPRTATGFETVVDPAALRLGTRRHDAAAGAGRAGARRALPLDRRRPPPDRHDPRRQHGRGPAGCGATQAPPAASTSSPTASRSCSASSSRAARDAGRRRRRQARCPRRRRGRGRGGGRAALAAAAALRPAAADALRGLGLLAGVHDRHRPGRARARLPAGQVARAGPGGASRLAAGRVLATEARRRTRGSARCRSRRRPRARRARRGRRCGTRR